MKTDKEYICQICGNPFKKFSSLDKTCRNSDCMKAYSLQQKEKKENKLKNPKILAVVDNFNEKTIKIPKIVKLLSKEEIRVVKGIELKPKKEIKPIKVKGEDYEFIKNSKIIKDTMLDNIGYLACQKCGATKSFKWDVHHIIYRSEARNHPKLHNLNNLILVCSKCHKSLHDDKKTRNELVSNRKLNEIFGDQVFIY